jgi:N-acetylneuraminic acid mutarotase
MGRAAALVILAALGSGPSADSQETSSAIERAMVGRFPAARRLLETPLRLIREERAEGARRRRGFVPHGAGSAPFWLRPEERATWDASARTWRAFFPASSGEPFAFEGEGVRVSVRLLGASARRGRHTGGRVTYAGAYRHGDLVYVVGPAQAEELIQLRSPSAPRRFEYEVEPTGAARVVLRGGALYLTDDQDRGLVLSPPLVIDAEGRRSPTAGRWGLGPETEGARRRLTLDLDPAGLVYPLLVDPTWTTTGAMTIGRITLTTTLLQTGMVLAVGGSTTSTNVDLYDPATGVWTPTAAIPIARARHTATLLEDGRVLVVGGVVFGGPSTTDCHLYDPASGTWAATGSLLTARQEHSATLLADGRVLVAGGTTTTSPGNSVTTAEVYDPVAGTWTYTTGPMNSGHRDHTATLLPDGRVLVAGGVNEASVIVRVTETFDPTTGLWTRVADLNSIHVRHTATLLPDNRVLVAGDRLSNPSVEIFDVSLGTWSAANPLATIRDGHTATLLPNGTVLVAGGSNGLIFDSTEVYDPSSGLWTNGGNLNTARTTSSAVMLANGKVIVVGGFNVTSLTSAELYDRDVGSWSATAGSLSTGRYLHSATFLPDGSVLAAGGVTTQSSAERFFPSSGTWSSTGSLNVGRYLHAAASLADGRVLVSGGYNGGPNLVSSEIYDPGPGTWTTTGNLITRRIDHSATLLPCGELLVVGGESSSGVVLQSAERYSPLTGTWRPTGNLTTGRWRHTATLLASGKVLVTGGWNGGTLTSAELYDPDTESWTPTGSMTIGRYYHTATLLPSGKVLVAGRPLIGPGASAELYDPATGTWSATGAMVTPRDTHRATLLPNGKVLVTGGFGGGGRLQSSELFDPATGGWVATALMTSQREDHTATLLLDGRILVAGGLDGVAGALPSSELYDVGRGEDAAWRPTLTSTTSPLVEGAALAATGSGFKGISEGSGGGSQTQSATNYPLVQLRRLDNEAVRWLPVDSSVGWSETSFLSSSQTGLVPGQALVTVFTNGIPGVSRSISVECPAPSVTTSPTPQSACTGGGATFTVAGDGGCLGFQWRKDGVPLAEGGHYLGTRTVTLSVSPVDAADVASYDVVLSEACSTVTATSAAASLTLLPDLSAVSISLAGASAVCTTCSAGTATVTEMGGGTVSHQWGFRTLSGGPVTPIAGETGAAYLLDGADFPAPGTYFLVAQATPLCGSAMVSNEVEVTVYTAVGGDDVQFFTVTSTSQENVLEWLNPATAPYFGTRIRFTSGAGCTFPVDPDLDGTVLVADQNDGIGGKGTFTHVSLTNGETYCYTAFVKRDAGGTSFAAGKQASGRPFDTSGPVKWAYNTGTTAMAPPGLGGNGTYLPSNDRALHGVRRGEAGGSWPVGPPSWRPMLMNSPAQGRPSVVPLPVGSANGVVVVASQDGFVYAVDANRGTQVWQSEPGPLGDMMGAGVAGMYVAFGAPFSYVFVGTRNSAAQNAFYALNLADGSVAASFYNGGGPGAIGIISGAPAIDLVNQKVYFASRAFGGGSPGTLWCLLIGDGSLTPCAPTAPGAWPQVLGDIDGSPTLRNGVVYVGANDGTVYAVDGATGQINWSFPTGDGPVKGFVFTDRFSTRLHFSTTNRVWTLSDDGASASQPWAEVATIPNPSITLYDNRNDRAYVGGGDGRLYQLSYGGAAPVVTSVLLGGSASVAVGSPALDVGTGLVYVGTDAGIVYAVRVALP